MRLRHRANGEEGIAMITVVLVTMVMLILLASTMAAAVNSLPLSRRDQDSGAALSAAEAGVDDYVARVNQNDQYYLYGVATTASNAGACYSASDSSTTYTLTMPAPDSNAAFSGWVAVPGSSNQWYRYTVDTSCLASQGAIILTVSGRGGAGSAPAGPAAVRTIRTTIRRRTFLNYIYFTDFETKDPALYSGTPPTGFATWSDACAKYEYAGRDNSSCVPIYFLPGDVISGPLHSNDELAINCGNPGPSFQGTTTTSWNDPATKFWWTNSGSCSGSSAPSFTAGSPSYISPLTLPPSNVAIQAQADATLGGTGCLFTGPTAITLNSNGTMNVTSPFTQAGASPNNCGATGISQPLPSNGVIYVQSVPASGPNSTIGCPYSVTAVGSTSGSGVPTRAHPLGYPQRYDIDVDDPNAYPCRAGDVFVQGTLNGRLTIAADNNINIVGSVTYANTSTNLLGLVANNFVQIYHPVGTTSPSGANQTVPNAACDPAASFSGSYCNLKTFYPAAGSAAALQAPVVDAAILAVNHSFRVPNYDLGPGLDTLHVFGAISQRFRGIVAQGSTHGYAKDYSYDSRLKYQSPPYYLDPVASAWQTVLWSEQAPAYSSTAT